MPQSYGEVERQNQHGRYFNEILRLYTLIWGIIPGIKQSQPQYLHIHLKGVLKRKKVMTISHHLLIMFVL
jgi:hypothetical protein